MNEKISIVIPIYNSEKYLEECIESIIKQTYKNLEIILVNDGSTDNSAKICVDFSKKDSRIVFLNKENSGVSDTRNCGIIKASGKYLMFVDSDDILNNNYIEETYKYIIDKNLDLCKTGMTVLTKSAKQEKKFTSHFQFLEKEEIYNSILNDNFFNSSCTCLYKTEIINVNNIRFNINIKYGEDLDFFTNYIENCNNMGYIPNCGYLYRLNENSVSVDTKVASRLKYCEDNMEIYSKFFDKIDKKNDISYIILKKINYSFKLLINGNNINYEKFKSYIETVKKSKYYNEIKNNLKLPSLLSQVSLNNIEIRLFVKNKIFLYFILLKAIKIIKKNR